VADDERYRLAALRDARASAERGKQHALASAVDEARGAQARLDAARARTETARSAVTAAVAVRDTLLTGATPALALQRAESFIARRRRELDLRLTEEQHLEAAHAAHASTTDRARSSLIRARTDRELLDRHFSRWRESRRKLADRRSD